MKYLWDTNIVIYYLQQQFPAHTEQYIDALVSEQQPILSVITEIELLSWKAEDAHDLEVLQNFINDSMVIELEKSVKLKAVEIRRSTGIKLPDAVIAATAHVFDLTLLTRNASDFKKYTDIKVINPFDT